MTIEDIIETLAKTDQPDGRIDAFITCAFVLKNHRPSEPTDFDGRFGYSPSSIKTEHGFLMAHSYTRSIDEAAELCQRILPGVFWHLARGRLKPEEPLYGAQLLKIEDVETVLGEAESNHPALALTLAALRAYVQLQQQAAA